MALTETQKTQLIDKFHRNFSTKDLQDVWIDDVTHELSVKAHMITLMTMGEIPVKFGLVQGHFMCAFKNLKSLKNAPHTVTGNFGCYGNLLTSLEGGPQDVGRTVMGGGTYACSNNNLINFIGAPQQFTGYFVAVNEMNEDLMSVDGLPPEARQVDITYHAHLPLLKLLKQKRVTVRYAGSGQEHPVTAILEKYAGTGKPGAIKCAVEMIRAGYKDNAKW
jgi:hypothetical protein